MIGKNVNFEDNIAKNYLQKKKNNEYFQHYKTLCASLSFIETILVLGI